MDWRIRRIIGSLVGLVVDLFFGLFALWLGWGGGLWILCVAAAVGVISLWNLNIHYRDWINDEEKNWIESEWLARHVSLALCGVLLELVGAFLLRVASNANSHFLAGVGVLAILCGVVPVVQVVRARLSTISDIDFPVWKAWGLNVLLIMLGALLPALSLATNRRGFRVGVAIGFVWLVAEISQRLRLAGPLWGSIGMALIAAPVLIFAFSDPDADWQLWVLLFGFAAGLIVMAGRQRKGERFGLSAIQAIVEPAQARTALLVAVLALSAGLVWLWAQLGGGVFPRGLLVGGVLGAVLFGMSLVTRGEGLMLVVAVGLLAIWVVQDHTVADEDSLPANGDGRDLILAFGDSYMSGEGTGEFITGTDVAGARSFGRGGENACRRSPGAYVVQMAERLEAELDFRACSGAKAMTDDFFEAVVEPLASPIDAEVLRDSVQLEQFENSLYGQFLRWKLDPLNADREPNLLLLSLGGNDAGFSKIGAACFLPGSCSRALHTVYAEADMQRRRGRLVALRSRVAATLGKAVELFPGTSMVVVAYPEMFGPDAQDCGGQVPFETEEINALGRLVVDLNVEVRAAADEVNAGLGERRVTVFAAGASAFEGERFCEADGDVLVDPAAMTTLTVEPSEGVDLFARLLPARLIHNTFHPTSRGHDLVARLLGPFLESRCWDAQNEHLDICTAGLNAEPEMDGTPTIGVGDLGAGDESGSGCDSLDNFTRCAMVKGLRSLVFPTVLLVLSGIYFAMAAERAGLIGRLVAWLTGRPFRGADRLAAVIPAAVSPLRGVAPTESGDGTEAEVRSAGY